MKKNYFLVGLIMVFWFMISFITNIIGPLIPDIIDNFQLSHLALAGFIPTSFFLAYAVISIPAGLMIEKFSQKFVLTVGWGLPLLGSLLFALIPTFPVLLVSSFTIGLGMAMLQTTINPLTRVAGGEENFAFFSVLGQLVFSSASFVSPQVYSSLVQKLSSAAGSLLAFANSAAFVVKGEKETHAYWVERVGNGERGTGNRRKSYVRLVAAPISVADDLHKLLYDPKDSVILCSATLRVGNDFKYMARRLGCVERFQMLTATSPFDYFRQALVLAPDCLPDPSANPDEYAGALAILMRDLFSVTHGRALVLFTSYEMMNAVAATAHQLLADAGITLLVQGEGLSRESMTQKLRQSVVQQPQTSNIKRQTVLFGAQSFWEGVDVAGEALSCVVLARLPFAQVGDPIVEARSEKIDREGGSSFRDYALPEAVIKFRQGFGRLVRTKSDRGVVVVTDPRIVTKNYGATFRKSIPASVHTVTESDDLLRRVAEFFTD